MNKTVFKLREYRLLLQAAFLMLFAVIPVYSAGQQEVVDPFADAAAQYSSGNLQEAAETFKRAASSADAETASAAYYNHGTVHAELARQTQDAAEKRELLESSYDSLKRAAEIGELPGEVQKQARRNMEVVRELLSQLPEDASQSQQQDGQDGDSEQSQEGEQSQQDGQQKNGQSGETSGSGTSDPQQMLQQQRELRNRTENGEDTDEQLARQQKQLQQASEDAGQNEAALNQQKAAEALQQGEREEAAEYQKAAENALAEAAGEEDGSEAEDILNREAEQKDNRRRLDQRGGISEADRNW